MSGCLSLAVRFTRSSKLVSRNGPARAQLKRAATDCEGLHAKTQLDLPVAGFRLGAQSGPLRTSTSSIPPGRGSRWTTAKRPRRLIEHIAAARTAGIARVRIECRYTIRARGRERADAILRAAVVGKESVPLPMVMHGQSAAGPLHSVLPHRAVAQCNAQGAMATAPRVRMHGVRPRAMLREFASTP